MCWGGGGQELSLKMCALGSAPYTEVRKSTNILPPRAIPHSGSMPLAWFSAYTPGCCSIFLGRFIVWLLPSHAFPPSLPTNARAVCRPHCPISAFWPETAVRTIPAGDWIGLIGVVWGSWDFMLFRTVLGRQLLECTLRTWGESPRK